MVAATLKIENRFKSLFKLIQAFGILLSPAKPWVLWLSLTAIVQVSSMPGKYLINNLPINVVV